MTRKREIRQQQRGKQVREQILGFVEEYIEANGYSPSRRDIQVGCSLASTSVVTRHLRILRTLGMLEFDDHKARSLRTI